MKKKLLFLLLMLLVIPIYVSASSYNITYNFSSRLVGAVRSFDGTNMIVTTDSYTGPTNITTFFIILEREKVNFLNFKSYDTIGEVTHPRNGIKTSTWSNVGRGKYRTIFYKAADGITVNGSGKLFN